MLRARACNGFRPSAPCWILWSTIADEFDQLALGGRIAAEIHIDGGQRQARFDMGRRAAHRVAETPGRLVEAALPARHQAEIVGQHRLVGVLGQRLAPQAFGLAQRAALRQADGEKVQNIRPLAVACQAERNKGSARSNHPARRYCRPVCRSGSGWGCVEDGDRGARAMARCVDPPHGQGYTKWHGQGCRSVHSGDGRCEAARRAQARTRQGRHPGANGRGTSKAAETIPRCARR